MNTHDEISKAKQEMEEGVSMFDTEAIYLARLEYLEHDDDECEHPESERWPFKDGMEVCALCGAIIHPVEVPF